MAMHRNARLNALVLAVSGLLVAATDVAGQTTTTSAVESSCSFSSTSPPHPGLTLTHLRVAPDRSLCNTSGPAANLSAQDAVIHQYSDTAVRDASRQLLMEASKVGIGAIRTMLWFRHKQVDFKPTLADERLGTLYASDGRLERAAIESLRYFAQDVGNAGLRRLLIVFGAQGRALTSCRHREWGDCYDPSTAGLSIAVIRQVSDALVDVANGRFAIEFDVSLEGCGAVHPTNLAQRSQNDLNQRMMDELRDLFESKRAYISCLADTPRAAEVGLAALDMRYRAADLRPSTLDVHI